MRFDELRREQYELGLANGAARINKLIVLLTDQGRIDDLIKAATDTEFQEKLLEEFGLTEEDTKE